MDLISALLASDLVVGVNTTSGSKEKTALFAACERGYQDVVSLLLVDSRTDPNTPCGEAGQRMTPLAIACAKGHLNIVMSFIRSRSIMRSIKAHDSKGRTALHQAARHGHTKIVRLLLLAGAEPLAAYSTARCERATPFYFACKHGHLGMVKYLFAAVSNKNKALLLGMPRNSNGLLTTRTPLHGASEGGHISVVSFLLRMIKQHRLTDLLTARDGFEQTPLELASAHGHEHVASCLTGEEGPLTAEALLGALPVTRCCFPSRADRLWSAHYAAERALPPEHIALLGARFGDLRVLRAGLRLASSAASWACRLLHQAARGLHVQACTLLLNSGAPVDTLSASGTTPLLETFRMLFDFPDVEGTEPPRAQPNQARRSGLLPSVGPGAGSGSGSGAGAGEADANGDADGLGNVAAEIEVVADIIQMHAMHHTGEVAGELGALAETARRDARHFTRHIDDPHGPEIVEAARRHLAELLQRATQTGRARALAQTGFVRNCLRARHGAPSPPLHQVLVRHEQAVQTFFDAGAAPSPLYTRALDAKLHLLRDLHAPRSEADMAPCVLSVRRERLLSDSFDHLMAIDPSNLARCELRIKFKKEKALDMDGVIREWASLLSREVAHPNYCLFAPAASGLLDFAPQSGVNPNHLDYFRFVGRFLALCVWRGLRIECAFPASFYKRLLRYPVALRDIEEVDPQLYRGLRWLAENPVEEGALTYSLDVDVFGRPQQVELKPGGAQITVTDANKQEYLALVLRRHDAQLGALQSGFEEVLQPRANPATRQALRGLAPTELRFLLEGQHEVTAAELRAHADYAGYAPDDTPVAWFWRAVEEMDAAQRAALLRFITGSPRIPVGGLGRHRIIIARNHAPPDHLPTSHTCFNQFDLPETYPSFETLRARILRAVELASEGGFGFR